MSAVEFPMISALLNILLRASRSLAGPIAFAGSNFLVAILLQRSVGASQFGLYAFCQVVIAAGLGVSNGLLGNPMTVCLTQSGDRADVVIGSFFRAALWYCIFGFILTWGVMRAAGAAGMPLLLMGGLTAISWFRWFIRSVELALLKQLSASLMDVIFGATSTVGMVVLAFVRQPRLTDILLLLMIASAVSLAGSVRLVVGMCIHAWHGSSRYFKGALVQHGGWATFTNVATQVSVNSHAYLITLMVGAAAFAPIALATLLYRPLGVILTGLVQYEQPRMASCIGRGEMNTLKGDVSFVRNTVVVTWLCNTLIVGILLAKFPAEVSRNNDYDLNTLVWAAILVSVITLLRALREPMATALQAAGRFRELAKIAAVCSPVPLLLSGVMLLFWPKHVALSLAGALFGEMANLILVQGRYSRFWASLRMRVA